MRCGEYLVALLARYSVTHVFGIPGVHTAELYRGLSGSAIRHITPRHEQGAGFMADGFFRASGRPGVCFVITGPGLTNIATAMAQAFQDSIPMLVISSVAATGDLGRRKGNLHELHDQQGLASKLTARSTTLKKGRDIASVLASTFAGFATGRPRPIHIEIPLDVLDRNVGVSLPDVNSPHEPVHPELEAVTEAVRALTSAQRPLILVGGGAVHAGSDLAALAERLDSPVVMTVNARGLLPKGHPLAVPASPSLEPVRALIRDSDVVLAIGTEIGPTDYDMYVRGGFEIPGDLIRADIDGTGFGLRPWGDQLINGHAADSLRALVGQAGKASAMRGGSERAKAARDAAFEELSPAMRRQVEFLNQVRDALPGAIIVGDSTQAVYAGNLYYEPDAPRGWFNSAVGYGTLGYALPAAIGAKLGAPDRPVVCLAGDGGLQYTLAELGSAIDAATPIIVLVWNNRGYGEIKSYFLERGIPPIGVDLATPDFVAIAKAYGWNAERLPARADLSRRLQEAAASNRPTLIELDEAMMMR